MLVSLKSVISRMVGFLKKIGYFFALISVAACLSFIPRASSAISFGEPLVDAAEAGDLDKVNELLAAGHYVDKAGDFDTTALMRATLRGDAQMVKRLIAAGAYVNAVDLGGETSLHLAVRKSHVAIARQLLSAGAKPNIADKQGWTPLLRAVSNNKEDITTLLVNAGANVGIENSNGNSALKEAVRSGKDNILRILSKAPSANTVSVTAQASLLNLAKEKGNKNVEAQLSAMFKENIPLKIAEKEPSEESGGKDSDVDQGAEIKEAALKPKKGIGYFEPSISVRDETSSTKGSYETLTSNVLRRFKEKKDIAVANTTPPTAESELEPVVAVGKNRAVEISSVKSLAEIVTASGSKKEKTTEKIAEAEKTNEKTKVAQIKPPIEEKKEIKGLPWKKEIKNDVTLSQQKPVNSKVNSVTKEKNKEKEVAQTNPSAAPKAIRPAPGMSYPVSWIPIAPLPQVAKSKNLLVVAADKIPQTLFVIQLGVFGSKEEAAKNWYQLRAKYEDILGDVVPVVKRVILARDGKILFRLRAGSFTERTQAETLCGALNKQNVECFVVDKANEMRGAVEVKAKVASSVPPIITPLPAPPVQVSKVDAPSLPVVKKEEPKKIEITKQEKLPSPSLPVSEKQLDKAASIKDVPAVVVNNAAAQAPISLIPPNSDNAVKKEMSLAAKDKVEAAVNKPSILEEVTIKVDQNLPWLTTPSQSSIPVPEQKIEIIAPPVQVSNPVPAAALAQVNAVERVPSVSPSQPTESAPLVKQEELAAYSTTIEEIPWKKKPDNTSVAALSQEAVPDQAIQKQTNAILANREALAQIPLKDFENDYANTNLKPEPLSNGQFKNSSVSEAVMVPDEGYHEGTAARTASFLAHKGDSGKWFNIGLFSNQQQAEDYYNRMFKFNADLQQVTMQVVPKTKGFSKGKVALQVGPIDVAQVGVVCQLARQNKLDCDAVKEKANTNMVAGRTPSSLPSGRRPVNQDMMALVSARQGGDKWIQLGTFSNKSEAEYYWMFLQEDHQAILNGLQHDLQNIVHGAFGGSAIGLKAGPFSSQDQAMQVCNRLSRQKVACALAMN